MLGMVQMPCLANRGRAACIVFDTHRVLIYCPARRKVSANNYPGCFSLPKTETAIRSKTLPLPLGAGEMRWKHHRLYVPYACQLFCCWYLSAPHKKGFELSKKRKHLAMN